jgi:hypothetical protein
VPTPAAGPPPSPAQVLQQYKQGLEQQAQQQVAQP